MEFAEVATKRHESVIVNLSRDWHPRKIGLEEFLVFNSVAWTVQHRVDVVEDVFG